MESMQLKLQTAGPLFVGNLLLSRRPALPRVCRELQLGNGSPASPRSKGRLALSTQACGPPGPWLPPCLS